MCSLQHRILLNFFFQFYVYWSANMTMAPKRWIHKSSNRSWANIESVKQKKIQAHTHTHLKSHRREKQQLLFDFDVQTIIVCVVFTVNEHREANEKSWKKSTDWLTECVLWMWAHSGRRKSAHSMCLCGFFYGAILFVAISFQVPPVPPLRSVFFSTIYWHWLSIDIKWKLNWKRKRQQPKTNYTT